MKASWIILLLFSFAPATASADNCVSRFFDRLFNRNQEERFLVPTSHPPVKLVTEEMWNHASPLLVNGHPVNLTFSFDGELPWDEVLQYIEDEPEAMVVLTSLFGTKTYTKQELLKPLHISEKQFDFFVFKKGTPLAEKGSWKITELPPRYFAFMMDELKHVEGSLITPKVELMGKKLEEVMKKRGLPVRSHPDVGFIEISHPSFESAPLTFVEKVKKINENFPKATIHMHIGIPNKAVTKLETISIARAMEARTILNLAANPEGDLAYHAFSSLVPEVMFESITYRQSRGVIRLGFDEFKTAHNFELRQYGTMKQGLEKMRFGATLSTNPKALYQVKNFKLLELPDPHTANLNGALKYMGMLFKNKGDAESIRIGEAMMNYSQEMETAGQVTDDIREEVRQFLNKNDVDEKIQDLSLYMKLE